MKAKFAFLSTALLALLSLGAKAQENGVREALNVKGAVVYDGVDAIADLVLKGSTDAKGDVNGDGKVNVLDIVELTNMTSVTVGVSNTSPRDITIAPRCKFLLADGTEAEAWLAEAGNSIAIGSGESLAFENVKVIGGRLKLNESLSNVIVYDDKSGAAIKTDMFAPDQTLADGGRYAVVYSYNPAANVPVINFNLKITNQSKYPVILSDSVKMVLGNPTKGGTYVGSRDNYVISQIISLGRNVSLEAGESATIENLSYSETAKVGEIDDLGDDSPEYEIGLGGRSPLDPSLLSQLKDYLANVVVYDTLGLGTTYRVENLSSDIVFEQDGTYEIVITESPNPDPVPEVISFNLKITNQSEYPVSLNGKVKLVLANPTDEGIYIGWDGAFNEVDLDLGETVSLDADQSQEFPVEFSEEAMVGGPDCDENGRLVEIGLGGRRPFAEFQNVFLYDAEGSGTTYRVDNLNPEIAFEEGGTYEIVIVESPNPNPKPEVPDVPDTPAENPLPVIGVNLVIKNSTSSTVNLNGEVCFVLGNPNKSGVYVGWNGGYLRTPHINYNNGNVSIGAGESRTFSGVTYSEVAKIGGRDAETNGIDMTIGLGNRCPASGSALAEAGRASNVLLYDTDGVAETYVVNSLNSDIPFEEGQTYTLEIVSGSAPETPGTPDTPDTPDTPNTPNTPDTPDTPDVPDTPAENPLPVIGVNLVIKNSTSSTVNLNGEVCFVLGNPNKSGVYVGWNGGYLRTPHINYNNGNVSIGVGESRTFSGVTYSEVAKIGGRDVETNGTDVTIGLGNRCPASGSALAEAGRDSNVLLYDTDGVAETYVVNSLNSDIPFENGQTYTLEIVSGPAPETPGTPDVPDTPAENPLPVIGVNLVIKNSTSSTVNLNGEVCFVLGNPNKSGVYVGWNGGYLRTPHINYNNGNVSIGAGESRTFSGVTYSEVAKIGGRDVETNGIDMTIGLGNRCPASGSALAEAGRASNVLLYDTDGVAETYVVNSLNSDIPFEEGQTYTLEIVSANSAPAVNPTPTPSGSAGGVISFNLRIVNQRNSPLRLNGEVVFVTDNPCHDGTYIGYYGPYVRTDRINYGGGAVTIGAKETREFKNVSYKEWAEIMGRGNQWIGMGGRSLIPQSKFAVAERASNVLLYDTAGVSETYWVKPLDSNIVFTEGGTYELVIP